MELQYTHRVQFVAGQTLRAPPPPKALAVEAIAQAHETGLRHKVLVGRMEAIDAQIAAIARFVEEVAAPANGGGIDLELLCRTCANRSDGLAASPRCRGRGGRLQHQSRYALGQAPDRDEDYARDGAGTWLSTGETVVRHGAPIDRGTFRALCAGLHPDTAALLVRGAGSDHWAGLDPTLTHGKSVSLLSATGTTEQRTAIEAAHRRAVEAALALMEREGLVLVRSGAGGNQKNRPSDLIVARKDREARLRLTIDTQPATV